jgi:putative ABC transport system permease protein
MKRLSSWRMPLRLARRDALRAKGRSALVLVMIALPVLAVTAADIVIHTADVNSVESLDRRLGAAQARVTVHAGINRVYQGADPDGSTGAEEAPHTSAPTAVALRKALGGRPMSPVRTGAVNLRTDKGVAHADATEADLLDPLTAGLFHLTTGRLPTAADEVVVNQALTAKGYAIEDELDLGEDKPGPTIVGVAEAASTRDRPIVAGPPGSLGLTGAGVRTWLVGGEPVDWATVRDLNRVGALVLSRAVVLDPPSEAELPAPMRELGTGPDQATITVVVLVVVMALLEVVLLAGPAFAVGARRQSRTLALLAATGGTPSQSRRVVLAAAVVLGGVASLLGVTVGIGLAWLLVPVVQHLDSSWFGPFEVPWLHLVGVAAFGLVSALLAAVVPAWIAARQDVVAVLSGRRGDRQPSLRSPVLGLLLLTLGVGAAVIGARQASGENLIAGSAIVSVLGMILLVPAVLAGLARLSGRLPLTLRFAVRDAARHRTRTVPAVAAVAATVAGVVALGISTSSDEAENVARYTPSLSDGVGAVTGYGEDMAWGPLRAAVERTTPDATVTPVRGLLEGSTPEAVSYFVEVKTAGSGSGPPLLDSYGSSLGSSILVSDDRLPTGLTHVPGSAREPAAAMLRNGGVVAFTTHGLRATEIRAIAHRHNPATGKDSTRRATLPALVVPVRDSEVRPQAVFSTAAAKKVGVPVATVGLMVSGTEITPRQEAATQEALTAIEENSSFYVERGYRAADSTVIIQLVLGGLGAILMLGGTLTATFLALSDARPDLATLAAVGASARTRRGVAAAYAMVVGVVGALLGAALGFIPGLAVTYPLTTTIGDDCSAVGASYCSATGQSYGPFVDVPWLLILGVVVVLPLVTALIVGLTVRSRLPLVARLE